MDKNKTEKVFEGDVEGALLSPSGGYLKSDPQDFDLTYGVDVVQLFAFIEATQESAWEQIVRRYGGDREKARIGFLSRLSKEIDDHGTITVLRKGIQDQQVKVRLAYFRPPNSMNDTLAKGYQANRLTITRQLRYSAKNTNTIDIALFLNGLLVATAELKNRLTGQNVHDAIDQYRTDRDPVADPFLTRPIVHFAADHALVSMTTELRGGSTDFLPFNQGNKGGAGNPDSAEDYATAYLWNTIWSREPWLDILNRFVQRDENGRDLFPRYHQWAAVTLLEEDSRQHGAGRNYLIQHSPGAGKSNSISWLAHRLSTLHDANDKKVFDKVIVITDRRVLDQQLRANVQQFERVAGVVEAVTEYGESKSKQLAEALASATSRIVITTLQTFPFVLEGTADGDLGSKNWAVIIDEAHSSQTGDAAAALRAALGKGTDLPEEMDEEDAMAELLAARGVQPNMSFYAFTATPKNKTVEVFGTQDSDGVKGPFHLYSMRQALEEGFILNVLENYTTYASYYRLATTSKEAAEKEVDVGKAGSALRRVIMLHPEVISQKARIMVEHFVNHTSKKIAGKAKAIVVTDSRAAAVRYKEAIDAYVASQGYHIKSIVAFSGTVADETLGEVTEASLNGFPSSQTGDRFKGVEPYDPGDYQVLIVAEKFQTGFDAPLLHTMFVDKTLTGLASVQTLSRLNRIAPPDKTDTFVLDFRNDPENIRNDFQRYFEATLTKTTDPNDLTDAYNTAFGLGVLDEKEVAEVVEKHFAGKAETQLGKVYAAFGPALKRFGELKAEDQDEFRSALGRFIHLYSFFSQVLTWSDLDSERLYIYGRALARLLPSSPNGQINLGADVVLTHLRLEDQGRSKIELEAGENEPGTTFPGQGQGKQRESRRDKLGNITEDLNTHYGLDLNERDRLVFEQFELTWLADSDLRAVALANDLSGFKLEFIKAFKRTVLDNEEANHELYQRLSDDQNFAEHVVDWYFTRVYELLRTEAAQPSGDASAQTAAD